MGLAERVGRLALHVAGHQLSTGFDHFHAMEDGFPCHASVPRRCSGKNRTKLTSAKRRSEEAAGYPASLRSRLAGLKLGETVLDLGSRDAIDVLLSARRFGPTGRAYGLDITDGMLALAREKSEESGHSERRVPQRRDRAHPAAAQFRRRDYIKQRDQSFGGQGTRSSVKRFRAWQALQARESCVMR